MDFDKENISQSLKSTFVSVSSRRDIVKANYQYKLGKSFSEIAVMG